MAKVLFAANALTGGVSGCLDDILHTALEDGNTAVVINSSNNTTYFFTYDASEAGAESSPDIIIPDSNVTGTGAWVLADVSSGTIDTVTTSVSAATDAATVSTLMKRDAAGRAKVVAPSAAEDIALKSTVTADIATHQALTNAHSATDAATASRIILRDAAGRAKVVAPSVAADIALKSTVTADIATHQALTDGHSATNAATASRIALRDASGNIKIGTAAADTDALNRVTADARYASIVGGSSASFSVGVTGTLYWEKSGNIVLVSWDQLSDFSATSITSTAGVIPAAFRPTQNHYNAVGASVSRVVQIQVSTAGTVYLYFRDYTGAVTATTVASAGSTTYRTA